MRVCFERGLAHAREHFAKTRIAREIGTQRQVVQEEADDRFGFGLRPVCDGRADDNVFLTGIPVKQNFEDSE